MSVFDIDENIESIDKNIRKYILKQLKSNRSIKFVTAKDNLKYVTNIYNGEIVYVMESDEVYVYNNKWIKI